MSRKIDHVRMTAEQLSAALDQIGLTTAAVALLTGTQRNTVEAWLKPPHDARAMRPPFWVTSWLALMTLPGAAHMAEQVAQRYLLIDGDHDAT